LKKIAKNIDQHFCLDSENKHFWGKNGLNVGLLIYLISKKNSQSEQISPVAKIHPIWGRCYDQNFLRFSPIFCEKIGVFSKTNVMIKISKKTSSSLSKNANFFAKFFGENI
jgi:hypothetical protein